MKANLLAMRTLFGLTWQSGRLLTFGAMALPMTSSCTGALYPLWLKLITDSVLAHDAADAMGWAVAMGSMWLINAFLGHLSPCVIMRWSMRVERTMNHEICQLSASLPGIEHLESPEFIDRLALLKEDSVKVTQHSQAFLHALALVMRVGVSLSLLVSLHPALLLLPILGVVPFWTSGRAQALQVRYFERMAEPHRRLAHIVEIACRPQYGKEARVFGLAPLLLRRQETLQRELRRADLANQTRVSLFAESGNLVFMLGWAASVGFVLHQAFLGRSTAGDVIMAINLASQIRGLTAQGAGVVSRFVAAAAAMDRYRTLCDYVAASVARRAHATATPPDRLTSGIELKNVSFTYPGTDRPVLEDVNLFIPAGATVAIVGENGAGKTSLVKLLCGFYDVTHGVITVDSVPLADLDVMAWRDRITASFQDFYRFELRAQETIGVGDLPNIDNDAAVEAAIDAANASPVVERLPEGLDTQLGRTWTDGTDLSGGQWQKLSLARAMMRTAPLLLVLDEPTSALDAHAEHVLFERYAGTATNAAATNGAITLLISHRFSTVSMANLIIVVQDGRPVEAGSHAELMRKNGLYAELYELQASAYR